MKITTAPRFLRASSRNSRSIGGQRFAVPFFLVLLKIQLFSNLRKLLFSSTCNCKFFHLDTAYHFSAQFRHFVRVTPGGRIAIFEWGPPKFQADIESQLSALQSTTDK